MRNAILHGLVLILLTLAAYCQVENHDFISFDDDIYVYENINIMSGINKESTVWAFTSVYAANWHPVTWLSHMIDVELYGVNPRYHHLTNLGIHIATTLLLYYLMLYTIKMPLKCLFVASMFAIHPLHVESVAWISERKDLLCGFFWCVSLFYYSKYVIEKNFKFYMISLSSFALGLMSKPMIITLPVIFLFFDYWPLRRFSTTNKHISNSPFRLKTTLANLFLLDKIPFFFLSSISAIITIYAQHEGGATKSIAMVPIGLRIANSVTSYVKYISKMLWPADLALLYPMPVSVPPWQTIGSLLLLIGITLLVYRKRMNHPYLVTGWFWFIITLVPVIGLIQVGGQSMADRYTYIPSIGLFIVAAWGIPALTSHLPHYRVVITSFACMLVMISAVLTWQQLKHWKDSISIYRQTLKATTNNYLIHFSYGIELSENGKTDEAIEEFIKAINIKHDFIDAHNNLGLAYSEKGLHEMAIEQYMISIKLKPDYADAYNNLGITLMEMSRHDEAIISYKKALSINNMSAITHNNLGVAYMYLNMVENAIAEFKEALSINPDNIDAKNNLTHALRFKN